jgi:hypothetical protein
MLVFKDTILALFQEPSGQDVQAAWTSRQAAA